MAKKKTTKKKRKTAARAVTASTAEVRKPRATKKKKKTTKKKRPSKKERDVTALITRGADVAKLVGRDRDDLTKWFNLYLACEEDPGSHTHRAKVGDIQWFLRFFFADAGGYHCDDWTKGRTKAFTSWLRKQSSEKTGSRLASSTCRRIFDTVKHAGRWIHRNRPFLAGDPFQGVKGIALDEPDWQGLSDLEVRRLKAAAEQLIQLDTRANQLPIRNYAILLTLLDSGLRVFELGDLELSQYRRRALHDIKRKGDKVTKRIPLSSDTSDALHRYIDEERDKGPGTLFQSKTGNPLAQQDVDYVLRRIASQANARLPEKEHIELSPHVLRHTALRKWTEKKGVQFAQKIAGHASERYIWRYVTPSESDMDQAAESLWE